METLIENPWISALIIFLVQLLFIYFRTLNMIFTAEKKVWKTIWSGNLIGACWLASLFLGIEAINNLAWQPILAYFLGGSVGTFWAFKLKI